MNLRSILSGFMREDRRRRTAVIFRGRGYTYEELFGYTAVLAGKIKAVSNGLRILVQVQNPLTYIVACLAADTTADVVGQLHAGSDWRLLSRLADEFTPDILITDLKSSAASDEIGSKIPDVLSLPEIWPDSPAQDAAASLFRAAPKEAPTSTVLFTSGSTGLPKGVVLPEDNIPRNAQTIRHVLALGEHDVGAMFGPLTMGMNQIYVFAHLIAGAAIVLADNFLSPNDIVADFAKHGVTGFSTIPAAIDIMLTRCEPRVLDALPLRYIRIGAGRFSAEKIGTLQERFPGLRVFKTYGLTEIGLVTVLGPEDPAAAYDSVGRPMAGVAVEILDDDGASLPPYSTGELVVSGAHQMREYYRDHEETAATLKEGRIHTGDLGYQNANGYVFITGRRKDMLKIAGESIHPARIEQIVAGMKGVRDAAAIAIEDPVTGEAAKVFVEPDGTAKISPRDILQHCRSELPGRLVPKSVKIVDRLPRTASGKVDRLKLRN
ncbi:MAG: acyl--CoA ligase [Desulfobacterales bacterium]|nr:MAG: acyl--CoA ligase [Desulfobacterales bacterium]